MATDARGCDDAPEDFDEVVLALRAAALRSTEFEREEGNLRLGGGSPEKQQLVGEHVVVEGLTFKILSLCGRTSGTSELRRPEQAAATSIRLFTRPCVITEAEMMQNQEPNPRWCLIRTAVRGRSR